MDRTRRRVASALAKARPGARSIASSGTATSSHLAGELLKMRAGIDLVHVPRKGAAPALTDLVGGRVQVMVDNLVTALPHAEVTQVLAQPEVRRRLAEMGGASLPMSTAQFGAFIAAETEKWGAVVRQAGIRAD
jgi:tripartite-type tricarboxylate transporter receptor subunit TctC